MFKKEQIWNDLKSSECQDVRTDLVLRPAWKWVSYAKEVILPLSAASLPSTSLSFNPLKRLAQLEQSRGDMIKCLVPTAQSPHLQCLHHQQERQREREREKEKESGRPEAEQVFAELHKVGVGWGDCSPPDHYFSPILFPSLSLSICSPFSYHLS